MTSKSEGRIILSTYPDRETAKIFAKQVVESRLAACVNLVKIESIYTWKGKLEDTDEYLAIFKTSLEAVGKLKETIRNQHPYEVPEIIEIEPRDISKSYLDWLKTSTVIPRST
ncbi:MAG: divalent-cation tolerance protein CutA [Thaumarchaeota archaeon]|nr:divalent-cation tolerance protein CutA [Nitrososphaerota archaeon]